jgi:hypothetical protein
LKDVTTICSDFFLCLRITIHELHLRNASVSVRGMYYYDGKWTIQERGKFFPVVTRHFLCSFSLTLMDGKITYLWP